MVIGTIAARLTVESVEEIDLSESPEAQNVFIDGGLYRCSVPDISTFDSNRACFVAGPIPIAQPLSIRAQLALCLCTKSRP